jgi:hypothetical protein
MAKPTLSPQEFSALLEEPAMLPLGEEWLFVRLPQPVSDPFPSRGQNAVEGFLNGQPFFSVLEPDGQGGHWMKVHQPILAPQFLQPGDHVEIKIQPATEEPEPFLPPDIRDALAAAPGLALQTWESITVAARRDWVFYITSAKKAETRAGRVAKALDMLGQGKRRVCCFDRAGIVSKSLCCPQVKDSTVADL